MSRRIPKQYTILISSTGRTPIALSFQPKLVIGMVAVAIAIPTLWLGKIFHSYHQKNTDLTQQNAALTEELTEEATQIMQKVEVLESELDHLQKRAGMPEPSGTPQAVPQGGISNRIQAESLLNVAQGRISELVGNLKGEIEPALEQTLEREAARPKGIPLKGEFNQTSGFGPRRNPFGGGYEFHRGLDFIAAYGSPIHGTAPGVVVFAGASGGYGNHVIVDHGYGYQTLYAHLSKLGVVKGAKIDRNQIVGYLGNTGRSTGPHLHYSVFYSGEAVDPKGYLD